VTIFALTGALRFRVNEGNKGKGDISPAGALIKPYYGLFEG
jgi:hypothetical protein